MQRLWIWHLRGYKYRDVYLPATDTDTVSGLCTVWRWNCYYNRIILNAVSCPHGGTIKRPFSLQSRSIWIMMHIQGIPISFELGLWAKGRPIACPAKRNCCQISTATKLITVIIIIVRTEVRRTRTRSHRWSLVGVNCKPQEGRMDWLWIDEWLKINVEVLFGII